VGGEQPANDGVAGKFLNCSPPRCIEDRFAPAPFFHGFEVMSKFEMV
jgi:hypothetical protein